MSTARRATCDYGPEFIAGAIRRELYEPGIETALIEPGKPWQNGADESFNGKLRDEYLTLQVVSESRRRQSRHRAMAAPLQRGPAAFESRVFDATRVQSDRAIHDLRGVLFSFAGSL